MTTTTAVDEQRLMEFVFKAVGDFGSMLTGSMAVIGDRLGLYRAMAGAGPLTPAELAGKTGTVERYVREWLSAQAAAGYVTVDSDGRFELPAENAIALTDETSPACVIGGFGLMLAALRSTDKLVTAFRTGEGVGWHEHHADLYEGTERFFRPGYLANLVDAWIPAMDGVEAALKHGARVADIGCGHGASTILMATAYPNSTFVGTDYHRGSIDAAVSRAGEAAVGNRTRFEVGRATELDGTYDLICLFDCLHDMGDPVGALAHLREHLDPAGSILIVEPFAGDHITDNLNPVGVVYYGASTLLCTPNSLSQEVGLALGAQAGESRLREVATSAGLTDFRRVAETPFNLVFQARR
ncbi:methyltransferase domain-containing protein [Actinoplanes sp. TBRC 11911]|uniref:class I SAM-dependent methyltransferase n=1 Tax=Actinoplanes sp. TBRC 11911 TaxID=2729386 RepID=UPI00145D2176|nr:class I SAM-dependent methyltransferase [Actinoplanes sp. TBRC 11911]NMO49731.1 methyltransferase domain-containing protein [Actinoplanes sp. TBRC 11911]